MYEGGRRLHVRSGLDAMREWVRSGTWETGKTWSIIGLHVRCGMTPVREILVCSAQEADSRMSRSSPLECRWLCGEKTDLALWPDRSKVTLIRRRRTPMCRKPVYLVILVAAMGLALTGLAQAVDPTLVGLVEAG